MHVSLVATESDFISDDVYRRTGRLVFLGTEGTAVVAFGSRYIADIRFPDPGSYGDGWGTPDWSRQVLDIGGDQTRSQSRYSLRVIGTNDAVTFPNGKTALYRTIGDNDIALFYFPAASFGSHPSLGLDSPTVAMEAHVRKISELLGQQFLLVSRESWNLLKGNTEPPLAATQVAAVAASIAATYVAPPPYKKFAAELARHVAAEIIEGLTTREASVRDSMASATRGDEAKTHDEPLWLFARTALRPLHLARPSFTEGGIRLEGDPAPADCNLLLVDLVGLETDRSAALQDFVDSRVSAGHLRGAWFDDERAPVQRVMLFDDEHGFSLNYELIANGMARLDVSDLAALRTFPEFVIAARNALTERQGFTARWADDARYERLLARAEVAIATDLSRGVDANESHAYR